jgi:hypothetical protein
MIYRKEREVQTEGSGFLGYGFLRGPGVLRGEIILSA